MKNTISNEPLARGGKRVMSKGDATVIMVASAVAAVVMTIITVAGVIGSFTGPVTLTLPLSTTSQSPADLRLGAAAHYTSVEATIPSLPGAEAALLAWADALNHVGVLSVLALLFLLALRLRTENLFTRATAEIIGACGIVLAAAGTVGQYLDQAARGRLAEIIGVNRRAVDETVIFTGQINLTPLVAGVALSLVAAAFRYGRRLQADTEGLV